MERCLHLAKTLARSPSGVLFSGESGTGKELIAVFLYQHSPRHDKPFLSLNCGLLHEGLQNSGLFGYARAAFIGSLESRSGYFEEAHTGTLFLDEIGELSPKAQVALLRVLETGGINWIGEAWERRVDVRVIAATHRNLDQMVEGGKFLEGLFFRLNILSLHLPPLRERGHDVLILAENFLKQFCQQYQKPPMGLGAEVRRMFLSYRWPGNVRELKNALERAVLIGASREIQLPDLPECLTAKALNPHAIHTEKPSKKQKGPLSREEALEALEKAEGNRSEAARILGVARSTLWRVLNREGN